MTDEIKSAGSTPIIDDTARAWAMWCHLGALAGFIIPFGNIIVPVILWALKKDSSALIDAAGKESINFQISMMIWFLLSGVLCFILVGFVIVPVLIVLEFIWVITAAMKAKEGKPYQYPITIRFFK